MTDVNGILLSHSSSSSFSSSLLSIAMTVPTLSFVMAVKGDQMNYRKPLL